MPHINTHNESENILVTTPQVIYKYPGRGNTEAKNLIDIIHLTHHNGRYYISMKVTPYGDTTYLDDGYGRSYDSLEEAMKIFTDKGYDKIVEKYKNGNILDLSEDLFKKYVPGHGSANTIEGELLRAIFKLEYRFHNDGDIISNSNGYLEPIAAPFMCLKNISQRYPAEFPIKHTLEDLENIVDKQEYEYFLEDIKIIICKYIILNEDNLQPNKGYYDIYMDKYRNEANQYFKLQIY